MLLNECIFFKYNTYKRIMFQNEKHFVHTIFVLLAEITKTIHIIAEFWSKYVFNLHNWYIIIYYFIDTFKS